MQWTGFHLHVDDDIWPDDGPLPSSAGAQIDIGIEAQLRVLVPK